MVKRKTRGAMRGAARPAFKINLYRMMLVLNRLIEKQDPDIPFSSACINIGNIDMYGIIDEAGDATPEFRQVEVEVEADENININEELWDGWTASTLPLALNLLSKLTLSKDVSSWDLVRRQLSELAAGPVDVDEIAERLSMCSCSSRTCFPEKCLLHFRGVRTADA